MAIINQTSCISKQTPFTKTNENYLNHMQVTAQYPSNAMGNVQSTGQEASHLAGQLANRHGFQILRIHENSPVSEVQAFPYFDYIIAINGVIVVSSRAHET
jgi:hypothetical protein